MKNPILLPSILVCSLAGCSTTAPTPEAEVPKEELALPEEPSSVVEDPVRDPMVVQGVVLENTEFDLPVRVNTHVERWVDYFTGRGRQYFELYLRRSEFFIPYLEPILVEQGLPKDLVYLAMIESGFNNHARSRARAVGPWQFISATGKRYGLHIDWWTDERRDVRKSTYAAAAYLKDLYKIFGKWELAAAGYNAGETKVARAIRRYGTHDYWAIIRHRFLRPETRNYVPKMFAAAILAKNREQFGFTTDQELRRDIQLTRNAVYLPEDEVDRVEPIAQFTGTFSFADEGPAQFVGEGEAIPAVNRDGEVRKAATTVFEIDGSVDLLKVARAAGLPYETVKALNPEILRWCSAPGVKATKLRLPLTVKNQFLMTYNHPAFPKAVEFRRYRVRRGDSLRRIARRYGMYTDGIQQLNGFSRRPRLRAGGHLLLPLPRDESRSLSSLKARDYRPRKRRYRRKPRGKRAEVNKSSYTFAYKR